MSEAHENVCLFGVNVCSVVRFKSLLVIYASLIETEKSVLTGVFCDVSGEQFYKYRIQYR